MHLRGHRPQGVDGGQHRCHPRAVRRHGLHGRGRRRRFRPRPLQVPRPLLRLRHGAALDGERRARPHRLRRPLQAGRGLPPGVVAAAPPAGPRGLPGRRLLPPQPPPRAGRQALRQQRRRFPHRPADHRDQGRRHLGLHPHQRHLDHRWAGLPPGRPVQVRCAARLRHRPVGVPGGRRRPDQGDEEGRGHAEGRPVPVPRARGLRRLRLRARQGVSGRPRSRLPPGGAAQAASQQPDAGAGAGRVALRRHQRVPRPGAGGGRQPLRARAARVVPRPPRRPPRRHQDLGGHRRR